MMNWCSPALVILLLGGSLSAAESMGTSPPDSNVGAGPGPPASAHSSARRGNAASPESFPLASNFDIAQYSGKVVLLNFWATWCVPCREEVAALVKLRDRFSEEEVAIVGISVDNRGQSAQAPAAHCRAAAVR